MCSSVRTAALEGGRADTVEGLELEKIVVTVGILMLKISEVRTHSAEVGWSRDSHRVGRASMVSIIGTKDPEAHFPSISCFSLSENSEKRGQGFWQADWGTGIEYLT